MTAGRALGATDGSRPSPLGAWARIGGTGAAASLGLALLVLAAVLISVALPRVSLSQRTLALRHTVAAQPATSKAVVGNLPYLTFDVEFGGQPFAAADLTAAGTELAADLSRQGLPLTRPFWSGLSTALKTVTGAGPGTASAPAITGAGPRTASALPPEMEILYRDQLTRYGRLTAGRLPQQGMTSNGRVVLQVAVTGATAARYGLRLGSRIGMGPVSLAVTGILTPADPGSAFWEMDPVAAAPALNYTPAPALTPYWIGACFIGPAEVPLLQAAVPASSMQVSWVLPLSLAHLSADQVTALTGRLSGVLAVGGMVANNGANVQVNGLGAANQATLSSGLLPVLAGFTAEDQAVGAVLGLLFVSLAVIGIVAVVLAAGLVAARRVPEFAVMRARGASLRQVTGRALASSAAFALPAAAAGAWLAILLTPGWSTAISWWLGGCALAAALAGVPLVVVARLRAAGGGRRRRARFTPAAASRRIAIARRLVAEAGLAAAAVGGIIVLRRQGLSAGSVDAYSSAAPVLVAALAAIVVVNVYPLALRLLLRLARVRPGVSAFVGLSRATRTAPGAVAVVFALVLALAMVAFGTMIDDAVHRGEVAESWSEVGADAVISSISSRPATLAVQREIAAVPGAARTAAVQVTTGTLSSGANLTVAVVNPAAYAALVAGTPAPAFPAASLARRPGPVPALASAAAAAQLPPGGARLTVGGRPLTVRPAGRARAIPGVTAGSLVVLPAWALGAGAPAASVILVVGPHLDAGRLAAVVRRDLPGASVTFRDTALSALAGAPLPAAAHVAITAAAAAAAAFSALILLISLLMGAPSREMTLARLATMGLGRGQARGLVGMETLPQVAAAIVGGVASAAVLGPLIAPSISLSAFTGSASGVPFRTEPLPLVAGAAGLILVAVLALAVQFLIARRRGVARSLRAGE
jgi:putative ABC transport system permease protein